MLRIVHVAARVMVRLIEYVDGCSKKFKVVDSFSDPHSTQNTSKVYSFEYVGQ